MTEVGVRVERRGSALVATLDRPECRNAISRITAKALIDFANAASSDPQVRSAIVTSSLAEVFASGADLRELSNLVDTTNGADEVLAMGGFTHAFERCEVPVIAAMQGAALGGGCELVLACDLVVVEKGASFSFRQAAMGLSTGWGGGTRLIERVGFGSAGRLLLVGDTIPASTALDYGLATELVPDGTAAIDRALELSEKISHHPRKAVSAIKRMLQELRQERRGDGFAREAHVFASLWGETDHLAAMTAFLQKRAR